jgi:hypothetical protein
VSVAACLARGACVSVASTPVKPSRLILLERTGLHLRYGGKRHQPHHIPAFGVPPSGELALLVQRDAPGSPQQPGAKFSCLPR